MQNPMFARLKNVLQDYLDRFADLRAIEKHAALIHEIIVMLPWIIAAIKQFLLTEYPKSGLKSSGLTANVLCHNISIDSGIMTL